MNIIVRRTLFYSFTVLFFVSATGIILYANGYRWNASRNTLEQTGGLVLETEPGGARATINGRVQESFLGALLGRPDFQTPLRVEYILPGAYEVLLEKAGYWPWKNTVSVEVQKTTYRTDVRLLPRRDAARVVTLEGEARIVFRGQNTLLIADGLGIAQVDTRSNSVKRIYTAQEPMGRIVATPSGVMIAWKEGALYRLMVSDTGSIRDIPVGGDDVYAFAPTDTGAIFSNKKGIFIFDITSGTTTLWRKEEARALAVHEGALFFSTEQDGKTRIWRGGIVGTGASVRVMDIDESGIMFREEIPGGQYLFAAHANGYLVPLDKGKQPVMLPQVTDIDATLFADGGVLYGVNPIEVWRFTVAQNSVSQDLITRHSNISRPLFAIPETNYIAYTQDGGTFIAQDVSTGNENVYPLATLESITDASFDAKKALLYVVGKKDGVWGIYQMSLE